MLVIDFCVEPGNKGDDIFVVVIPLASCKSPAEACSIAFDYFIDYIPDITETDINDDVDDNMYKSIIEMFNFCIESNVPYMSVYLNGLKHMQKIE